MRSCLALRDLCLAYGIPLLSGKDSMYVDGLMPGAFGEMHRVSGLPTLFFTAVSVLPDLGRALTLEWKRPGDLIYLVGDTRPELGGSEFYEMLGYVGLSVPEVRPEEFLAYYRLLEEAGHRELLASAHGLYRGGLGVHLALCQPGRGAGRGGGPEPGGAGVSGLRQPLLRIGRAFPGERGPGPGQAAWRSFSRASPSP